MLKRNFFSVNFIRILFYLFFIFLFSSCSIYDSFIYCEQFHQGNYFTEKEIKKIRIGMNKREVIQLLGYSLIEDLVGGNKWYYVNYRQIGCNNFIKKNIVLVFDKKNILIRIQSD